MFIGGLLGKVRGAPASLCSPTHQPLSLLGSSPPTTSLVNFCPEPKSLTGKFLSILNKNVKQNKKIPAVVIQQRSLAEVTFSDQQRGRSKQKWKTPTLLQSCFLASTVSFLCWEKKKRSSQRSAQYLSASSGGCRWWGGEVD